MEILGDEYDITEAEGGKKAIEILQNESSSISLVLLDAVMSEMDGYAVLEQMKRRGIIDNVPVIMISAESSPSFITKAFDIGAVDYVSRPSDPTIVQLRVRNTITLYS